MTSLQPAAQDESLQVNMLSSPEPGQLAEVRRQWVVADRTILRSSKPSWIVATNARERILERLVLLNQSQCTQDVLSTSSFDNSINLDGCR